HRSVLFTAAALTRTSTWPGPGDGTGTSSRNCNAPGPPNRDSTAADMTSTQPPTLTCEASLKVGIQACEVKGVMTMDRNTETGQRLTPGAQQILDVASELFYWRGIHAV